MFIDGILDKLHRMQNWAILPPWLVIVIIFVVFLLGWLFPLEGPLDWTMDKYSTQPATYNPVKKRQCCPAPAPKKTEIYEDFNEDGEPEWYQLIPMFEVEE